MVKNILIRKATMKDFSAIDCLSNELIGKSIGNRKSIFREALKNKHYVCIVAEFRKQVIGFIDAWSFPDVAHGAYLMQIQNLIVKKEFRGRGVGKKILKAAVKIFKKNRCHELHVSTEKENKRAIKMYKKLGLERESVLLEMER